MRLAIIGYGKMGKTIEKIAIERGHSIAVALDKDDFSQINKLDSSTIDVAVEFTEPISAFSNIKSCIDNNIPVVSGTTGWLNKYDEIATYCNKNNGAFFYASNFSVGVNLFFKLNKILAELMATQEYEIKINETHHTQKKDAPSGTAITLVEGILQKNQNYSGWSLIEQKQKNTALPIESFRVDKVPGTHEIIYHSNIDDISIKHTAHTRKGFAMGAVLAAEWLINKTGTFGMDDMLKI